MALATQCPYCQTTFKVAHDQLKLRSGLVRCGTCKQVFNGIEHLVGPDALHQPAPPKLATPAPAAAPAEPVALRLSEKPSAPAAHSLTPPPTPSVPIPTMPAQAAPASAATTTEEDPLQGITLVDAALAVREEDEVPQLPTAKSVGIEVPALQPGSEPKPAAPAEIAALIATTSPVGEPPMPGRPVDQAAPVAKDEADVPVVADATATASMTTSAADEIDAVDETVELDEVDDIDEATLPPEPDALATNAATLPREETEVDEKTIETIDEEAPEETAALAAEEANEPGFEPSFVTRSRRRQRIGRIMRVFMAITSVFLLLSLALQGAYVFRNQLAARFPQAQPALAQFCQLAGCQIRPPAQIDMVAIESSDLQVLSADQNTFVLTLLLRNHGAIVQAWPDIELTLNDANETALARRILLPRDYLPPKLDSSKGFAGNSEQPVKLNFELAQLQASGYRVYLFYP